MLCVALEKVAARRSNSFTGIVSVMRENFFFPCSIVALRNACCLSKLVSCPAVLPICVAYLRVASSNLTRIPNSSRISGSSFAVPRTRRSIASGKFLPSAREAPFATRVKSIN